MSLQTAVMTTIGCGIGAMVGRITWAGWPSSTDDAIAVAVWGGMAATLSLVFNLLGRRLLR